MKTSLLLFLTVLCLHGRAQDGSAIPSKWLVGLETGLHIAKHGSCSLCFTNDNHYSLRSYGILAEHRVLRWLSVRGRLGYTRLRANDLEADLYRRFSPSGRELTLGDRLSGMEFTLGPRLQYRLGQGDLGIEYRHGYAWRWLNKTITTSEKVYSIDYQTNRTEMTSIRLSYTYWPRPNWAIELAYEGSQTRNPAPFEPDLPFEETFAGTDHPVVNELQWSHGSHIWASYIYISFFTRL